MLNKVLKSKGTSDFMQCDGILLEDDNDIATSDVPLHISFIGIFPKLCLGRLQ